MLYEVITGFNLETVGVRCWGVSTGNAADEDMGQVTGAPTEYQNVKYLRSEREGGALQKGTRQNLLDGLSYNFV